MNKKVVVAIPHSHSWFWSQTCVASLKRNPPQARGCDIRIVVVNNSPWSPAIRGITDTPLGDGVVVVPNYKSNKFHASALDCIVEREDFEYLMALETDVLALRPTWLQWFIDQMRHTDYAVGMWHHEQFINPSCTLYRGSVLRAMLEWSRPNGIHKRKYAAPQDELRWGPAFEKTAPLDNNLPLSENPASVLLDMKKWIGGPFAEKRGWHEGTILKEKPSGQEKGPGWYEPGQQLHHWAVEAGRTYTVCPNLTTKRGDGLPLQSMYGNWGEEEWARGCPPAGRLTGVAIDNLVLGHDHRRQLEAVEMFGNAETAHLWGGTRALDILKHPVTCQFVKANTPGWLAREARFWRQVVPPDIQEQTLELMRRAERETGSAFHITGQGTDHVTFRDREAAEYVRHCYAEGGVTW